MPYTDRIPSKKNNLQPNSIEFSQYHPKITPCPAISSNNILSTPDCEFQCRKECGKKFDHDRSNPKAPRKYCTGTNLFLSDNAAQSTSETSLPHERTRVYIATSRYTHLSSPQILLAPPRRKET